MPCCVWCERCKACRVIADVPSHAAMRPFPSPDPTSLCRHGGCRLWGLCDAATRVCEDGTEHDCFAFNDPECRCQVRQSRAAVRPVSTLG